MFGLTKGLAGLGAMFTGSKAGLQVVGQILSVPVLTRLVNLAVITLVVCMLMFAWLDRYETVLDDETTLSGQDSFTGQPGSKVGTPSRSKGLGEYRAIAGRDLFGTVKHAVTEEPKQEEVEIEQMPLASLRLKLMGTVVASDPAMRTAVIAEANGRNERMYREGESVKGATIKKILRYAVVLNTGKRDEVLKMETPKNGKGAAKNPRSGRSMNRTPVQVVTLDRDDVQRTLKDIPSLLSSARFERYRSGGINGYKLRSLAKNSGFSKLGLRSNDIILGVNGAPLTNLNQATALYDELERGGRVSVNIKRFGRQRDIALRLE